MKNSNKEEYVLKAEIETLKSLKNSTTYTYDIGLANKNKELLEELVLCRAEIENLRVRLGTG